MSAKEFPNERQGSVPFALKSQLPGHVWNLVG
jgi:hypothetical protein